MGSVHRRALGTFSFLPAEGCTDRYSDGDSDGKPDGDVSGENPSDCSQARAQRDPSPVYFVLFIAPLQFPLAMLMWGQDPSAVLPGPRPGSTIQENQCPKRVELRSTGTAVGGCPHTPSPNSSRPRPAASGSCRRFAAPCRVNPQAACPRASRTTPAPAPPSWRCPR